MPATDENPVSFSRTASQLGGVQGLSLGDQSSPRNLHVLFSVEKPTSDVDAAKLAEFFRSQPGNVTWGDVPADLRRNIQSRLPDVELKADEPVAKVFANLARESLSELGKQEGLKLVAALKEKLGPDATYALLGALAAGAAAVLAKDNPGLVAQLANQNLPNVKVLGIDSDHAKLNVTLTPQLAADLGGAYLKYKAELNASTSDLNYAKKPPAQDELVAVGDGSLRIHRLEGGAMVAMGKDGKVFPIPATMPGDEKNIPITSREQVSAYLTTQLEEKLRFMSPEQEKGIAAVDLFPKIPAKDAVNLSLTADGSTLGKIEYSGGFTANFSNWKFGAGVSADQSGIKDYNFSTGVQIPDWRVTVGAELKVSANGKEIAVPVGVGIGENGTFSVSPVFSDKGPPSFKAGFELSF
jgi:hypothetical protein